MARNCCSCELWSLTGIPCVHSIVAFHKKGQNPHDLVNPYYSIETFNKLYDNVLVPVNGSDMWPKGEEVQLDPPRAYRQTGRPRKARKRQFDEGKDHGRRIQRRIVIHCRNCGGEGHNRARCTIVRPTTSLEPQNATTTQPQGKGKPKGSKRKRQSTTTQLHEKEATENQSDEAAAQEQVAATEGEPAIEETTTTTIERQREEELGEQNQHVEATEGAVDRASDEVLTEEFLQRVDEVIAEARRYRANTRSSKGEQAQQAQAHAESRRRTTRSRAQKSLEDFEQAWLGEGSSRNKYSHLRKIPKRKLLLGKGTHEREHVESLY